MIDLGLFLRFLQNQKRYSVHTVQAYHKDIEQFFFYCTDSVAEYKLENLTYRTIRGWIAALADQGVTTRTINRKLSALKTFCRFLEREELLHEDPFAKILLPKISKNLPSFYSEKSMDTLLDEVEWSDSFSGKRDRLVFHIFYACGLRVSELISLKISDIDLQSNKLNVFGKRKKQRSIPFYVAINSEIRNYLRFRNEIEHSSDNPYLFITNKGSQLYPKFVDRLVKRLMPQASTVRKKSAHVLRHTFATQMLNHGADLNAVKELLGHSSLAATQVYTHNTYEKLKKVYKQAHPRA